MGFRESCPRFEPATCSRRAKATASAVAFPYQALMPGPKVELGTPEFSVPRLRGYRTTSPASIKKAT